MRLSVIGAGSFGTAMSMVAARCGHQVMLWSHDPAIPGGIARTGKNPSYLVDFPLGEKVTATGSLAEAAAFSDVLVMVVPSHHYREVLQSLKPHIKQRVRVISATNRDLKAAMTTGAFRSDLFYRLNVFPIEIPPLRERKDDIPMLVEYFIDRYATEAGKKIRYVSKESMELLQSYPWPGNVRELQNVIERSVILCETETFSVDESWLSHDTDQTVPASQPLVQMLATQEKALIETALAETRGQVSGPTGAAAKLSMRPSTLESKIRTLKINKHRFKAPSEGPPESSQSIRGGRRGNFRI